MFAAARICSCLEHIFAITFAKTNMYFREKNEFFCFNPILTVGYMAGIRNIKKYYRDRTRDGAGFSHLSGTRTWTK